MKLCMFSPKGKDLARGWPGRIDGDRVVQLAAQTLSAFFTGGGRAREHAEYALADVDLRAPVMSPPSIRVFPWLGPTDFWFGNTASIRGPEDEVAVPEGSAGVDYGLALAAVIGADGAIAGFTLANTWTAAGLEGVKSRDFATSIGPVLVTPDEFPGDTGALVARVDGEERSKVDLGTLAHPWSELAAHAVRNTRLRPGDLLIVDAGAGVHELRPGQLCEIEAEGIGVLRNRIA